MLRHNKNNYKSMKDYNYNQMDGYFAWPTTRLWFYKVQDNDFYVTITDVHVTILTSDL
jgi:hypothetical protein